jgi:hypothetical protein
MPIQNKKDPDGSKNIFWLFKKKFTRLKKVFTDSEKKFVDVSLAGERRILGRARAVPDDTLLDDQLSAATTRLAATTMPQDGEGCIIGHQIGPQLVIKASHMLDWNCFRKQINRMSTIGDRLVSGNVASGESCLILNLSIILLKQQTTHSGDLSWQSRKIPMAEINKLDTYASSIGIHREVPLKIWI